MIKIAEHLLTTYTYIYITYLKIHHKDKILRLLRFGMHMPYTNLK